MSRLVLASYREQVARWPQAGRHVMAQFDADTVVMYQAYRPEIGRFAAADGRFGGGFSLSRTCRRAEARARRGDPATMWTPREEVYPLTVAAAVALGA